MPLPAVTPAVTPVTPDWAFEREHWRRGYFRVAGVDEAGRGAWAGPLVAAAVILPPVVGGSGTILAERLRGVRDSKLLSPGQRRKLVAAIAAVALGIGVGQVAAAEIDTIGLGEANRVALRRAIAALPQPPDYLLLDAFPLPQAPVPQLAIVRGDRESLAIAAASIVAKVTRDEVMVELDRAFPAYGFGRHKGYGTDAHRAAIVAHGSCPEHRHSFAPLCPYAPPTEPGL